MKKYPFKEIAWNFFTVCLGVFASINIFYFLFFMTAILPGSWNSDVLLMILLGISAFLGSFLTTSLALRHKLILGLISLILMVIIFINFFDVTLNYRNHPDEVLQLVCVVIPALTGAVAGALPSRKSRPR